MQHRKVKSVAKTMVPGGKALDTVILETMKAISDLVGATLGPGGKAVLIERQEFGVPNLITKDGVTVFRSLGFGSAVAHAVMEAARDASIRTATEAGDGTTTATVLSEAFVRKTHEFCKKNPKVSPQRVVRTMEKIFRTYIEPYVKSLAQKPDLKLLRSVALTSANGDVELADAIATAFALVGDDGNVTLSEHSGPSGYAVEQLKGYPSGVGYEECLGRFFSVFVNDQANSRVYMEKPVFVLYNGQVTEMQTLIPLLEKIGERWGGPTVQGGPHNIVVIATGFSDTVVGELAANWGSHGTVNVYPMTAPKNIMPTAQLDFLVDVQAVTGSTVFDPITRPIQQGELSDVGEPLEYFEATRWRSNIVGTNDESLVLARVEEVQAQLASVEGIAERVILQERLGKLTGGIAKLMIFAPTNGELREKRDRAEDAACAWRGAVKHGVLPGGGWTLLKIVEHLNNLSIGGVEGWGDLEKDVFLDVMWDSLMEPVWRLLFNGGYSEEESSNIIGRLRGVLDSLRPKVFDVMMGDIVDAERAGVIDSVPAVLEAIRNSLSIASLLGSLGGIVVFPRDTELERSEASENYEWKRNAGVAP
ncbi:heat shock protein 60 family chaperone GroEL [Myxococcus phage Mx1]|nr:heat shock protein 60 family chaperone GroEL [Myxococcus phage Mx1]